MTPTQRDRAIEVMQTIQVDVEADTLRRDGQALTGPNVARALGELAAQIGAVARGVELLLREQPTGPTIVNSPFPPSDEVECCASGSCEVCKR